MGFQLTHLKDFQSQKYIGSKTMYSCADNGAFDGEVSVELEKFADENLNVMAIVDAKGVEHFLKTLRSGACTGRNVQSLIEEVSLEKYKNGFMIIK